MSGTTNALAVLFVQPQELTMQEHEEVILSILDSAIDFDKFAVHGNEVIILNSKGRTIAEKVDMDGGAIVVFDHYPAHRTVRLRFWFNASSVADLGDALRARPEDRIPFDEAMTVWSS